jgi:protein SCO1/2
MLFPVSPTATNVIYERRNAIKLIAGYAVSMGAMGIIAACSSEQKPQFQSIDLTGADYAKDFSLVDQNGQLRSIKDFAGKVVVVFFGFTQCPDVCPTSMAELAQIKKTLGPDGDKLQAVFITVDPERDTPELLKAYMGNFDPSFIALRPTLDQLPEVAKNFKVYYKKVDGKTSGSYSMDHSAGSYVYDTKGRIRLYSRYGTGPEGLTSDIRLLLKSA